MNASSIHHIAFSKYTSGGAGITTNKKKSEWKSRLGCTQLWSVRLSESECFSSSVSWIRISASSLFLLLSHIGRLLDMRCNTHTHSPLASGLKSFAVGLIFYEKIFFLLFWWSWAGRLGKFCLNFQTLLWLETDDTVNVWCSYWNYKVICGFVQIAESDFMLFICTAGKATKNNGKML